MRIIMSIKKQEKKWRRIRKKGSKSRNRKGKEWGKGYEKQKGREKEKKTKIKRQNLKIEISGSIPEYGLMRFVTSIYLIKYFFYFKCKQV